MNNLKKAEVVTNGDKRDPVEPSSRRLLFLVTEDWYFCSHRLPLAIAAIEEGYETTVVTRVSSHAEEIRAAGLDLIPIDWSRSGRNPVRELVHLIRIIRIYRSVRPDITHHVALKPVLYGAIAARIAGVKHVVSAIAGLGYLHSSASFRAGVARSFLQRALGVLLRQPGGKVLVQNPEDAAVMQDDVGLSPDTITLIRGAGVDTNRFAVRTIPSGDPIVLLASRMLWDKGVGDFVEAARILKRKGTRARFVLVGEGDSGNPGTIPDKQLHDWAREGAVEWWGQRADMPTVLGSCSVFCLPTAYGEGVPKVLLEAAACGRPIVATDAPGCREVVVNGENGILVPTRDPLAVADALMVLLSSPSLRRRLGERGRNLVESGFNQELVIAQTLALYQDILR